jgi:predicted RNase H-like HicB family nuclease
MTFFPAIVEGPGSDGGYCADVLGTGVLGQGDTAVAALTNAAEILQEVIDDFLAAGRPLPVPAEADPDDLSRGTLAMLQASLPAHAA